MIDPLDVVARYGVDALRYYMLRDFSPFGDGDFTLARSSRRYRADLANDLGNLLNRTVSMLPLPSGSRAGRERDDRS